MDLNLFDNLKKNIESIDINNFIDELNNFLKNINLSKTQNDSTTVNHEKETEINNNEIISKSKIDLNTNPQKNRKEGHLYLVTEDRNNEIYLWDFTDKPKHEFKETISSDELLSVAKEGAMLQYINGEYKLYSPYGYDMLFDENSNGKIEE